MSTISLRDLKSAKERILAESQLRDTLASEITRVVGPAIQTDRRSLNEMCVDLLQLSETNEFQKTFKPALLARLAKNRNSCARRVAARFMDPGLLECMINDPDVNVLYEVSTRAPIDICKKIANKHRLNDQFKIIYREKLNEVVEIDADNKEKRREVEAQSHEDDVLDDFWYDEMARKIYDRYGNTTDTYWIRLAANQEANAVKSMLGIPVDVVKLTKSIQKLVDEHDEAMINYHNVLKVTVENLQRKSLHEGLELSVVPEKDEVKLFLEENHSTPEIIESFEKMFNVKKRTPLSHRVKGLLISEGIRPNVDKLPTSCRPPMKQLRECDEAMLNAYVEAWSKYNNPVRLAWTLNGDEVLFNASVWEIDN